MNECVNCKNVFEGKFCPECGEKVYEQRISFQTLLESLVSGITNADRGLLHNLKNLTIAPAKMIHGYIAGKRKQVFNPVSYAILITTVYIILDSYIDLSPISVSDKSTTSPLFQFGIETGRFLKTNLKYFWLLNIVVLSFFTQLFFRTYNYVEHLTINAFVLGQATLLGVIFAWQWRLIFNPLVYLALLILLYFIFKKPEEKFQTAILCFVSLMLTFAMFYLTPVILILFFR